jgi:hypothetical protein
MKRFYGLLLILTLIVLVSAPSYAQTPTTKPADSRIVVDQSILTPDQLATIKAKQATDQVIEDVSTYSKIAGIGKEVGIAVKEGLLAVVDVADKFSGTNVGKFTMTMIAWKIVGKDVVRIIVGLIFLVIFMVFIGRYYRDNFTVHKVAISDNGWKFWLPKQWKIVDPNERRYDGYEFVKWLTILMVVAGFGVTYAIMFG